MIPGTTLEMNVKGFKSKNGTRRFKRFQALDDALIIFFHLRDHHSWVTTTELVEMMEWDYNPATQKRTRRICESLVRVGKVETKRVNGGSVNCIERMWRILE